MGFFKNRKVKTPDVTNESPGAGYNFLFGGSSAGQLVNESTAMQTSAVYACVRVLAEAIASLPLHVHERNEMYGKVPAVKHPLYRLLHDAPNPEMTSFIFRETLMIHLLIYGNAYAQIIRDGRGQILGLYPLLPNRMNVLRDDKTKAIVYEYTLDGQTVRLKSDQVLHIPGLGFDGLIGYSPIAMAKNAVGIAIATEQFGATFFKNGANPSGALEHPGTIKDPQKLRDNWSSQFTGENANRVAVLEEGLKFTPFTIPPEQAQFLQTRKFQLNEIARIFRVPLHLVGDLEKSSFNNIEQQSLEFVMYTLNPWVVRWEQAVNKALILETERDKISARFNVDGLLRGQFEARMKGYATARQNGWYNANDIRAFEDMNLIPAEEGGDLYLVNGNMVPLQDAGAAYKKQTGGQTSE